MKRGVRGRPCVRHQLFVVLHLRPRLELPLDPVRKRGLLGDSPGQLDALEHRPLVVALGIGEVPRVDPWRISRVGRAERDGALASRMRHVRPEREGGHLGHFARLRRELLEVAREEPEHEIRALRLGARRFGQEHRIAPRGRGLPDRPFRPVDDNSLGMVDQVLADRQIGPDLDPELAQLLGRADPGEEEQLRRVEDTRAHDHLAPSRYLAAGCLDPRRAPFLVQQDAKRLYARPDLEILREPGERMQVRDGARPS
jgi:hypothetical protein